jgi:diadenosine tetraphosphatase ApaH/serine/threonine PP2A family protein phosphatase
MGSLACAPTFTPPRPSSPCLQAFNYLPVAALIDDRILVLHGGLGPHVETIDDIANVKKGKSIQEVRRAWV